MLVDYQFKVIATQSFFPSKNDLTGFMGIFSALVSAHRSSCKCSSPEEYSRSLGLVWPCCASLSALLFGSVVIAVVPGLISAVMAKLTEGSLRFSINKASLELLYLPLPWAIKAKTKPFIDPAS